MLQLRHKQSGKTAIGIKGPSATVLVQFDDKKHPQAFGIHLYPRSAFKRAYKKLKE
jgi:hypothetical protein